MRKRNKTIGSNIGVYAGVFLIVLVFSMLISYIVISKNIGNIMSYIFKGKDSLVSSLGDESSLNDIVSESESSSKPEASVLEPEDNSFENEKQQSSENIKVSVRPSEITNWVAPKVRATDNNYFEYALFVGDSQISGLADAKEDMIKYSISRDEIDPEKALSSLIFGTDGAQRTMIETMDKYKPSRIYIMVGGRSLTYLENKDSINYYEKFIEKIKQQHPTTPIFVHSVLPVTKKHEENNSYDNSKIENLNQLIEEMCRLKSVYFLDVSEGIIDENGYLNESYAAIDGQKLNTEGYTAWENYLKEHWIDFS